MSLILKLFWIWFGYSALRIFAFPWSPYGDESAEWQVMLSYMSVGHLLAFALISQAPWKISVHSLRKFFQGVWIFNLIMIGIGYFYGKPWGILWNPSMSGCFLVALAPLFIRHELVVYALTFLGVLCTAQSQPLAGFFVGAWLLRLWKRDYRSVIFLPLLAVIVGFMVDPAHLFHTSGRTTIWHDSLTWWKQYVNVYFGSGGGTFMAIGPYLSRNYANALFGWLHSDWLQILFEQGVIGLSLSLLVFLSALSRAKSEKLLLALLLYGAFMLANMPLHYPLAALYGSFLIRWAFLDEASKVSSKMQKSRSNFPAELQKIVRWRAQFDAKCRLVWRSLSSLF